jgi:hypothetical protein
VGEEVGIREQRIGSLSSYCMCRKAIKNIEFVAVNSGRIDHTAPKVKKHF